MGVAELVEDIEHDYTETILPLDDMLNMWDMADEVIPHLFDRPIQQMAMGEAHIMAGDPGVGKTALAAHGFGYSVAFGRTIIPGYTPARRGRVLFHLGEDGRIPIAHRGRAWCEHYGISREEYETAYKAGYMDFCCGKSEPLLTFGTGEAVRTAAYSEALERCTRNQYDLVIVDSLSMFGGMTKDVDAYQMHMAVTVGRELAQACGGAVLFLHHLNKEGSRTGVPSLNNIRGSGSAAAKIRWAAQLSKFTEADCKRYHVGAEHGKRLVRLDCLKNQYDEEHRTIVLERHQGNVFDLADVQEATKDTDVLPHLVAELRAMPLKLSQRQIYRNEGQEAKDFRDRVERRAKIEAISNETMKAAIQAGIDLEQLQEVQHPTKKTTIVEVT